MIKRLLILLAFSTLIIFKSEAQCTPQPGNIALITPDTVTNFASGTVGVPYQQLVYVHPPDDTTVLFNGNLITVQVVNIILNSISNLPPGLTYASNPANGIFPGNTSGCLLISGTPTTPGLYNLSVIITTNATWIGIPVSRQDTIESYRILINPNTSGIPLISDGAGNFLHINSVESGLLKFQIGTTLKTDARIEMFDLIGNRVYSKNGSLIPGINNMEIQTSRFGQGIYFLRAVSPSFKLSTRIVLHGRE